MAKKSMIVKNQRRRELAERHADRRAELRCAARDVSLPLADRLAAGRALQRLPRDSAAVRVRRRDQVDGRPRGHLRKAGLSRVRFRQAALNGELPGVTKSSW